MGHFATAKPFNLLRIFRKPSRLLSLFTLVFLSSQPVRLDDQQL